MPDSLSVQIRLMARVDSLPDTGDILLSLVVLYFPVVFLVNVFWFHFSTPPSVHVHMHASWLSLLPLVFIP